VCARIGSTQCVIDEGVDGLLVDPNDTADIARAIIELLSDERNWETMDTPRPFQISHGKKSLIRSKDFILIC